MIYYRAQPRVGMLKCKYQETRTLQVPDHSVLTAYITICSYGIEIYNKL